MSQEWLNVAPAWVPDEDADKCIRCAAIFTFIRRRHHCRNCGRVVCGSCSSKKISLPHYGIHTPVRVCDQCYANGDASQN